MGRFTVDTDGQGNPVKGDKLPKPERYTITEVRKLKNGKWMFRFDIKYGKLDLKGMRIPLTVKWAGDTPMISEDDFGIAGIGSGFRCRVMFDGSRYSGTWSHNKVGGLMFGQVEKAKAAKSDDAK